MKRTKILTASLIACAMAAGSAMGAEKDIVATAVEAGSSKTLATALQAAELVGALQGEGPFTVFAPTDEAFGKLPDGTVASLVKPEAKKKLTGILTYHVVPGKLMAADVVKLTGAKTLNGQRIDFKVNDGKVSVDGAQVLKTDIECSNGVIHVIDSVIMPATDDLATTAVKAGDFETLVAAAKAAGLVPALSGADELTVFAPTDEAFAALPEGTVANLLKPENKNKLASILKYHIVPGRVYSTDAVAAKSAKTLQGGTVKITSSGGSVLVNEAKLMAADIDASNGVIHVINRVILPPDSQASTKPTSAVKHATTCDSQSLHLNTVSR